MFEPSGGGIAAVLVVVAGSAGGLCCSSREAPAAIRSPTVTSSEQGGSRLPELGSDQDDGEALRLEGVLTAEGVECQALRTADNELFTLTGDLQGFAPGDRVRIEGRIARFSICMQGTTVAVESIERLQ